MKKKNRFAVAAGIAILLVGVFSFVLMEKTEADEGAKGRIAYVDVWTVFNIHPDKSSAERELNQLAQEMQAELEEKAKDLPEEQQQEMLQDYQNRLTQREQELIQTIINRIKEVIIEVAEEKEVKVVLDKQNVIYGGYDMTPDVVDYIEENTEGDTAENNTGEDNTGEDNTGEDNTGEDNT